MVEWLLQNSLGQLWLAMCKKHGWTPDFDQVRDTLEQRRGDWRKRREAGEVAADALMPIESELEDHWKYWVLQPMPEDAPKAAPESLKTLKLLDPACGSGHFLVIAFDLLAALYQEEAHHRGEGWSHSQIAGWIVEHNLHGIDIDPRAIQIAAAAVWLKAKIFAPEVRLSRMNLVAPTFKLATLPDDDPALERLAGELKREVGIPAELTRKLVSALAGVDHLGSLLRVDKSINEALTLYDKETRGQSQQGDLFTGMPPQQLKLTLEKAKVSVLDKIGLFLDAHQGEGELGLRLEGQQLAAGVRFVQVAREGAYDIVVGNPPYQGTSKMAEAAWFKKHYPRSKADLYACFLERGLEFSKRGGVSALLTMRGWMFLSQFTQLREELLADSDLRVLCDIDKGGFEHMATSQLISVALTVQRNSPRAQLRVPALQPTAPGEKYWDRNRTPKKRADVLVQRGRFEFDVAKLSGIEGTPLVYWWDDAFLDEYIKAPKLGQQLTVRYGLSTQNNVRWLRKPWEVSSEQIGLKRFDEPRGWDGRPWVAYIKGAEGQVWCDQVSDILLWRHKGLELASYPENRFGRGTTWYYQRGVAFSNIGASFSARAHSRQSIFGHVAGSVFAEDTASIVCLLNSRRARYMKESLNPSIHFLTTDVERLALFAVERADEIFARVEVAFVTHESHREPSVEYKQPGPSPWRYAQDWAQRAVDRAKGDPLPPYEPELDPPNPTDYVSFAIGVALGRFGANGEGILDLSASAKAAGSKSNGHATPDDRITAAQKPADQEILPGGILFISAAPHLADSLEHAACKPIEDSWSEYGAAITAGKKISLRDWLRKDFFGYHKKLYENRPIYFPLSSDDRSFVAYVSIHRWADNTLQTLLASHLHPAREKLEGEIHDLNAARVSSDKKQQAQAEKQYAKSQKLLEELEAFIRNVTLCAEKGAPPTDPKCPPRETDAPFRMDLDDGVMVNSAALWPLLDPQWKDPKKWWKELCTASGRKDYDWAHLSARYFPTRVDQKCKEDPSLGVAHGCFWKYHPAKAYAWELRLQDEIAPDFTIDETSSEEARAAFLKEHAAEAAEIEAKEQKRRERHRKKQAESSEAAGAQASLPAVREPG